MDVRLDAAASVLRLCFADIGEFAEFYSGGLLRGAVFVPFEKLPEEAPGDCFDLELTLPVRRAEHSAGTQGADVVLAGQLRSLETQAPRGFQLEVPPLTAELRSAIELYLTQVLRGEEPDVAFPAGAVQAHSATDDLFECGSGEGQGGQESSDGSARAGDRALAFQEEATGRAGDGRSIQMQLRDMTHAERIRLALSGGKAARAALIRNPQPVYHPFVIQNPRITRSELAAIAKNPNVAPEALRMIAANAQHMSDPAVRLNVVKNPKTDLQIAQKFLPRLPQAQLRQLARSEDLRAVIKAAAVRLLTRSQR